MEHPKLYLNPHRDERLMSGHLWVFSNEIERTEGTLSPGGFIDVYSHRKKFLGRGFYNAHSLIAARLLSRSDEPIDSKYFTRKLGEAAALRSQVYPDSETYRLIFGESDGLPGLIIDRFQNCFVIQSHCLGMDVLMPQVLTAIKKQFHPAVIVLKNDSSLREMEGLKQEVTVVHGALEGAAQISLPFASKNLNISFDVMEGQKTGYFLDQRENKERLARFCKGRKVLDCFSYVGGFGLYAAAAGASETVCVDSSESAVGFAQKNFEANGLQAEVLKADVFEAMESFQKENVRFDIIVLDPPAFAKSKKNYFGALRKYSQLNKLAISILNKGGILCTSSCSYHVSRADFLKMIGEAAAESGRIPKVIEMRGQAQDHPIHPAMPETEYLKCAIARID